jgi:hypothetical protein
MAFYLENPTLGSFSSGSALSLLVGALFEKLSLFRMHCMLTMELHSAKISGPYRYKLGLC